MRVDPFGQELAVFTRRRRASAASSALMPGLGLGTYSTEEGRSIEGPKWQGLGGEGKYKVLLASGPSNITASYV